MPGEGARAIAAKKAFKREPLGFPPEFPIDGIPEFFGTFKIK